jgi:ATP-dependent DNA helicase RecG
MTRDVEQWGSGLKRMSDECKSAGIKVTFEKIKSGFLVTFYRPDFKTDVKITKKVIENDGTKPVNGLADGLVDGLVENQKNMAKCAQPLKKVKIRED